MQLENFGNLNVYSLKLKISIFKILNEKCCIRMCCLINVYLNRKVIFFFGGGETFMKGYLDKIYRKSAEIQKVFTSVFELFSSKLIRSFFKD